MQPGRRCRVAPSIWMGGRRCVRWRWRGEVLPSGQRAAGGGVTRARVDNCLATSQEARRQDGGRCELGGAPGRDAVGGGRGEEEGLGCRGCGLRFKGKAAGGVALGPEGRRRGVPPYRVDNLLAAGGRRRPRRTGTGPQDGGRRRMQGEGRRSVWSGRRGNGSASGSLPLGRTPSGQEAAAGG